MVKNVIESQIETLWLVLAKSIYTIYACNMKLVFTCNMKVSVDLIVQSRTVLGGN